MKNLMKNLIALAVLLALGLGTWHFGLYAAALSWLHLAAKQDGQMASSTGGAVPAGASGRRGGSTGPVRVMLAEVKPMDLPLIERTSATIQASAVVSINARITSQVKEVPVSDGAMVKAGDILVVLDDRALQATLAKDQATLAKNQATLVNARLQMDRAKSLAAKNVGPLADADAAVAAEKAAEQVVQADLAQIDADKLQIEFTTIRAPFAGKLGTVNVVPGALVSATPSNASQQTSLMTITQMQPVKVNFRLPEKALQDILPRYNAGSTILVTARAANDDVLDTGPLNFIDSAVDSTTGTISMSALLKNERLALWPGQHVEVDVQYGTLTGALTVPVVAVQQGQQGSFVWRVDEQSKVSPAIVKVSRYEGGFAAISDGLAAGDKVVIEGQAKMNTGTEVKDGPAETASGTSSKKPDQKQSQAAGQ